MNTQLWKDADPAGSGVRACCWILGVMVALLAAPLPVEGSGGIQIIHESGPWRYERDLGWLHAIDAAGGSTWYYSYNLGWMWHHPDYGDWLFSWSFANGDFFRKGDLQRAMNRHALSIPQHVVDTGSEAPLIRFSRQGSGNSSTNGSANGGWQVTHALAALAGDTAARERILEQIRYTLEGGNAINSHGGLYAQYERPITGAYAIIRNCPETWNRLLTGSERHRITLLMKATLVASAYTTADATYEDFLAGVDPTALDGDTNLHRDWNPNYREGMFGGLVHATVFFGGVAQVEEILNTYDHAAFVADLDEAGLTNPYNTFTFADQYPHRGAPAGGQIEDHIRDYRYLGEPLKDPMGQLYDLMLWTYQRPISCGLDFGAGILHNGVPTGVIASGCEGLPNKLRGSNEMLREFDAADASGPRSSITYAYMGYRSSVINHVVVIAGGFWEPGSPEAHEIVRRMDIGTTDLHYKLLHGYRNYAHGRGDTQVRDIDEPGRSWSYRALLPLWMEAARAYHFGED